MVESQASGVGTGSGFWWLVVGLIVGKSLTPEWAGEGWDGLVEDGRPEWLILALKIGSSTYWYFNSVVVGVGWIDNGMNWSWLSIYGWVVVGAPFRSR